MRGILLLSQLIDGLNSRVAGVVIWSGLIMVIVSFVNALLRRIGHTIGENLTSTTLMDIQWILFGVMFLFVGGYAILTDTNVRVDVFYDRLSARTRCLVNGIGCLLFILPFSILVIYMSESLVTNSLRVMERSTLPGGVPPWIIKPLIPLAFLLVGLQSISEAIKNIAHVTGHGPDPGRRHQVG